MGNTQTLKTIAGAVTSGIMGSETQDEKLPDGDKYIGLVNVLT